MTIKSTLAGSALAIAISANAMTSTNNIDKPFEYVVDRFADIEVLRYKVPGFEQLSLNRSEELV